MGRGIHGIDHAAGDIGAAVRNDGQCILHGIGHGIELVAVLARAEAECADNGRVGVFREDGDGKVTAVGDALICVVVLIDAHHHRGRGGRNLCGAVGGAAGRAPVVPCGYDVNAVRKGMECFGIHRKLLLFTQLVLSCQN